MNDTLYKLIGFADPGGVSLGFLVPLFAEGRTNAPLVQLVEGGIVAGFEPYGAPEAASLPAPAIDIGVGDLALHAFAFGKGDVAVTTRDHPAPFADRLDDPVLAKRPLVAMELADFLQITDRRCEFAALAHAEMSRASKETADHWRDLSVLTIELRRELARRPDRSAARLADVIVARVSGGVMEIAGTGDRPSALQFASLKEAAVVSLETLSQLYPPPEGGWEVTLRWRQRQEPKGGHEAALLLASLSALNRGTRGDWPQPPNVKIFTSDGPEFARVVEETRTPLFVAYDSGEPEQMRRATGDWTVREMHGIGIAAPRRLPVEVEDQYWRTTHIYGASISGGASQVDRGVFAGMRLAIAVELNKRSEGISWSPKNALLLRARGLAPDSNADGWAALYDRAWGLGVDPSNSLLLRGREDMPVLSQREPGWAARALFQESRYVGSSLIQWVMDETRSSAALLVDASPRSEAGDARHRLSVRRLLEQQGWRINDRDAPADLAIYGQRTRIALTFEAERESFAKSMKMDVHDVDLGSVEGVVVTCAASPSVVMERLARTRQLAVNVRDLVLLDAREATVFSLLGAQLRRLVTGLPSGSRTRFLAMLIVQAFRSGNVHVQDSGPLNAALSHQSPSERTEFAVSSARFELGITSAEVRLLKPGGGTSRTNSQAPARYRLSVAPDGVAIADM